MNQALTIAAILSISIVFSLAFTPADPMSMIITLFVMGGMGIGAYYSGRAQGIKEGHVVRGSREER